MAMAALSRPPQGLEILDRPRLPTLAGERVVLRWMTARDTDALYEIYSDPETTRFWSTTAMTRKGEARQLLREIREEHQAGQLHEWGMTHRGDDHVIGTCTLFLIDHSNRRAEVGFALGRRWWGRGLMCDGLTTLLDFAFNELGLRRIEADVDPRNRNSIKLLEGLGFRAEGLLRERWNVGGELQDCAFYGLLARDYTPGKR
jgi:[ribosomal protein S5]-alanine N-acetyltransferase